MFQSVYYIVLASVIPTKTFNEDHTIVSKDITNTSKTVSMTPKMSMTTMMTQKLLKNTSRTLPIVHYTTRFHQIDIKEAYGKTATTENNNITSQYYESVNNIKSKAKTHNDNEVITFTKLKARLGYAPQERKYKTITFNHSKGAPSRTIHANIALTATHDDEYAITRHNCSNMIHSLWLLTQDVHSASPTTKTISSVTLNTSTSQLKGSEAIMCKQR